MYTIDMAVKVLYENYIWKNVMSTPLILLLRHNSYVRTTILLKVYNSLFLSTAYLIFPFISSCFLSTPNVIQSY